MLIRCRYNTIVVIKQLSLRSIPSVCTIYQHPANNTKVSILNLVAHHVINTVFAIIYYHKVNITNKQQVL